MNNMTTLFRSLFRVFAGVHTSRRKTLARAMADIAPIAHDILPGAALQGRVKGLPSILYKMCVNRLDMDQVFDSVGVRVILEQDEDCYRLVDRIHRRFRTVDGRFDDYIRRPKPNGYRSLHTTILDSCGSPLEVQVRTRRMHALAEQGAAAHWLYEQPRAREIPRILDGFSQDPSRLQELVLSPLERKRPACRIPA